jgi:hypothetical protein
MNYCKQYIDLFKELPLTSTRAREILSKVASRGEKGYRIFKKLLRESKQEHLADYLGRQEIDLEKKLMAEKKNEDKGKQVELQVPAATVKANAGKSNLNKPDCLSF